METKTITTPTIGKKVRIYQTIEVCYEGEIVSIEGGEAFIEYRPDSREQIAVHKEVVTNDKGIALDFNKDVETYDTESI